ncbi:MAG TPA: ATP-binding protein [Candidatus Binatia bacterium]|nr:ATP-binding protein [Candidatus Binatia bacterium]
MSVTPGVAVDAHPAGAAPASTSPNGAHTIPDLPTVLDRDRRAGVERVIELARWIVLVFAAVTVNFPGNIYRNSDGVDLLLGIWAIFTLATTVALLINRIPTRRVQYAMLALDIAVASGLVDLTGGFQSELGIVFYLVIIASSLRFGLAGSLICASSITLLYLGIGLLDHGQLNGPTINLFAQRLFLFMVIALISGLLSREMIQSRARQLTHTYELEAVAFNELREVDRIKSDFMMLASHELRTPLTKIKAWVSLMQDAGDRLPQSARDEGIRELRVESEHLARLTDNLLAIAQLESGEIRLKTTACDLANVIGETISRFIESADRSRFLVTITPDAARVMADAERLALTLACLVDNALKFSPESEPVTITSHRDGAYALIGVHDNGRRIPDSEADRVFASFYQVESPLLRQRGGFGVGLYLARQLVERMGGRIWIDNSRVRGNTFVIALPGHI